MKKLALMGIVALQWPILVAGCGAGKVGDPAERVGPRGRGQPTRPTHEQPASVAEICREPSRYVGQTLVLEGVFQGFRVAECRFPDVARSRGLTRSDWLIRTDEDCLYVTGGAPQAVDLLDPELLGRRLELTARLARDDAGKLYLELVEALVLAE